MDAWIVAGLGAGGIAGVSLVAFLGILGGASLTLRAAFFLPAFLVALRAGLRDAFFFPPPLFPFLGSAAGAGLMSVFGVGIGALMASRQAGGLRSHPTLVGVRWHRA